MTELPPAYPSRTRPLYRFLPAVLLLILLLTHLPFLFSDPDTHVDIHTRGAWTDEGLYAAQTRNFLLTGSFGLQENSTMIRGPLFSLLQLPFFAAVGAHLWLARLVVLIVFLLSLFLLSAGKTMKTVMLMLLVTTATQFHLFSFSHYAMAEMVCVALILLAALCVSKVFDAERGAVSLKMIFLSSFLLFLAYGMKIQYLYVAALVPATLFVWWLMLPGQQRFKAFYMSAVIAVIWFAAYVLLWYLPNKAFYDYVMLRESGSRFPVSAVDFWNSAVFNWRNIIWIPALKGLFLLFFVSLLLRIVLLPSLRGRAGRLQPVIIFGLLWILLELHKLPMTYLPHRYLLPLYAAVGLVTSLWLSMLLRQRKIWRYATILLITGIVIWNGTFLYESYMRRTKDLQQVSDYLSSKELQGKTVIGPWAPSVTWRTKARTLPVWQGFLNDDAVMDADVVITEVDQEDSDASYHYEGYSLESMADSVRYFTVWRYELAVYWMHGKPSADF